MLAQYESLFHQKGYMGKVLELIYIDILKFHHKAYKYFKQRSKVHTAEVNSRANLRSVEAAVPSHLEDVSLPIQASSRKPSPPQGSR
jgi:hypothetical protein